MWLLECVSVPPRSQELLESLFSRWSNLAPLSDGVQRVHELDIRLDRSQRSIYRAPTDLEVQQLLTSGQSRYRLTLYGWMLVESIQAHRTTVDTIRTASEFLLRLPRDTEIDHRLLSGPTVTNDPTADPDSLFDQVEESVEDAMTVRGMSTVLRRRYVDVFAEHVLVLETDVEFVLNSTTVESFWEFHEEEWRETLSWGELHGVGCWRFCHAIWPNRRRYRVGLDRYLPEPRTRGLVGTIHNRSAGAVECALEIIESCRTDATQIQLDDQ